MMERPLLLLPTPEPVPPLKGRGGGDKLRKPTKEFQSGRFSPTFRRLQEALSQSESQMELRENPTSLAPDRVIVFEVAGSVDDFAKAVSRVDGLEFMAEEAMELAPDENFSVIDNRKDRKGQDRLDKPVGGRFYLAFPNAQALSQLVGLWNRWDRGERLGAGLTAFEHVFSQLHALRPWGPQDRISDDTIQYWQEEASKYPGEAVRTEVELWFHNAPARRESASQAIRAQINAIQGEIIHETIIPEIAYHGLLIDIPQGEVEALSRREQVSLALADDVMFLRPQSMLTKTTEIEMIEEEVIATSGAAVMGSPIAALLDGVPLQNHQLLTGRLEINDADSLEARTVVMSRTHGTAMASLIVHGDLNANELPIGRPLHVRPIMYAPNASAGEGADRDRLIVDTLYRAVIDIKGTSGQEGAAPSVFIINLSIGDVRRPFTKGMSPFARLLDYLSYNYRVLFFVSAGNIDDALDIAAIENWSMFESAAAEDRQHSVLEALHSMKHERTILSPSESLNALTIGSCNQDNVNPRLPASGVIDPFDTSGMPNISCASGLGYRRSIKPELLMPGGREHIRMQQSSGPLRVKTSSPGRAYGLKAAAPDAAGQGRLDKTILSNGTSSATALATRSAHQIFDALTSREENGPLRDLDSRYNAVVMKALLVHGARWPAIASNIGDICGPAEGKRYRERCENISRFLGFGIPDTKLVTECAMNRATFVGCGELVANSAHHYKIPLPLCLEGVTVPRSLTLTVAWFSPVKAGNQRYRCVRLEAEPFKPIETLGVNRPTSDQPNDEAVKRGTVFHEHYNGNKAVAFVDNNVLSFRVSCKEDAGIEADEPIYYGVAVTIGAEALLPIYDEIRDLIRMQARTAV